jgi:hypothetical protein
MAADMPFINHAMPGAQDPKTLWRSLAICYRKQAMTYSFGLFQIDRSPYHAVEHHRMRSVTLAQNFNRERFLIRHAERDGCQEKES